MRYLTLLLLLLATNTIQAAPPSPAAPGDPYQGGAVCLMAKWMGNTLDYALVYGKRHPVLALDEAEKVLRKKGYADYKVNVDIMHQQASSHLTHAFVIIIKSRFKTVRGKLRTSYGCGFSPSSHEHAQQLAIGDLQAYSWGWSPEKYKFEVVEQLRY
ncbi:MAG: hypothetical protein ABW148_07600 [Sedimenticola sp.]